MTADERQAEFTVPVVTSQNETSTTSIVKYEKSKIILVFTDLTKIEDADDLTDKDLFESLRIGFRVDSQVLGPLCASFLKRFKKAKKDKQEFHGFKNLTRACPALTGYSSQQVRNLAAGTPTPVKKASVKQLTPAEKLARHEAQKLQDKLDLATARAVAVRNASNVESQAAQRTMPPASATIPVIPVSQQEVHELRDFKKTAAVKDVARLIDVEETDALLDYILKSVKLGTTPSVIVSNKIYSLAEKLRFHREKGKVA